MVYLPRVSRPVSLIECSWFYSATFRRFYISYELYVPNHYIVLDAGWTNRVDGTVHEVLDGYGGLVVPDFAGSNPAEVVGFFGHLKNHPHAFLRRGSERICPMSQLCGM